MLVIGIGDHEVRPAVAAPIASVHAHAGARVAVHIERHLRREAGVLKRAVAPVDQQQVWRGVAGDASIATTLNARPANFANPDRSVTSVKVPSPLL